MSLREIIAFLLLMPALASAADSKHGREIVTSRQSGLCLLCHSGPFPEAPLQGNLAPSLAGVGSRMTADQIRHKLVEPGDSIMPSFSKIDGKRDVAPLFVGKPILTPAEIDDVVAFLVELR